MDLDEEDFVFCQPDLPEPILCNELLFPETEKHGDFDVLSEFLPTRPQPFRNQDVALTEFPSEGPDEGFAASSSLLEVDGNPTQEKPEIKPEQMLQHDAAQKRIKPKAECDISLIPDTAEKVNGTVPKVYDRLRETSSRLPMDYAPTCNHQAEQAGTNPFREAVFGQTENFPPDVFIDIENAKDTQLGFDESIHRDQHISNPTCKGQTNDLSQEANQQILSIQLSEIPSIPTNALSDHNVRCESGVDNAVSQIDLNRIPSGNCSEPVIPGTPKYVAPQEDVSQPKLRYSEGASASHYCHICGRASNTAQLAACANVRIGLCRKTLCEKCLLLHQRELFHWAKAKDTSWTCTHCRGVCPKRARCHQYQRNNMRRRMKNTKASSAENTKETLKVEKRSIAKTSIVKKSSGPKGQTQARKLAAPEALKSAQSNARQQFSSIPLPLPKFSSTLRHCQGEPNRDLSRKDSSQSQNELSAVPNSGPFDPIAHINVASREFEHFDASSIRRTEVNKNSDAQEIEAAIGRSSVPPKVDLKGGENEISPTGIIQGIFSAGTTKIE